MKNEWSQLGQIPTWIICFLYTLNIVYIVVISSFGFRAWGVLPIMAYKGRLRLKGVPFSRFRYIKEYGFQRLILYKRVGKLVI